MKYVKLEDVNEYVESNIGNFHSARLRNIEGLKLDRILKRKNPYLFKAKNILTAGFPILSPLLGKKTWLNLKRRLC